MLNFLLLFFSSFICLAAPEQPTVINVSALDLEAELKNLASYKPEEYADKANESRERIERALEFKRHNCSAKDCQQEVKNFQVKFINEMYEQRKKFLKYIHEQQLDKLEKTRDESLKNLGESLKK